ncbi:hypothetical protein L873DRAFT_1162541 [Choiromyces venosus 120613-1]|uniref:Uncharacterized protein n=1 Tax=Choiromyces venosus 120613-1 TaxID=1336337 RepID=A0A3N4JFE0_9PEZI|nr:hypothetical protein L873DRAFT_1162541 [Choiromyces venosus 120613-1]
MFRLLNKQAFKPMGIHYYPLQVHHLQRAINTTLICNTDKTGRASGLADFAGGKSIPEAAPYVTLQCFVELSKTITAMRTKVDHLKAGQKEFASEMDKRFDMVEQKLVRKSAIDSRKMGCLVYFFVGSLLVTGALDLYFSKGAQRKSEQKGNYLVKK